MNFLQDRPVTVTVETDILRATLKFSYDKPFVPNNILIKSQTKGYGLETNAVRMGCKLSHFMLPRYFWGSIKIRLQLSGPSDPLPKARLFHQLCQSKCIVS